MAEHFDNNTYQTGHTQPPKSRGGMIALLLAIIIFLCGIVSILGLLNIHLFQKLMSTGKSDAALAEVIQGNDDHQSSMETVRSANDTIIIDTSPVSEDHYPQEGGSSLQQIYTQTTRSLVSVVAGDTVGMGIVLTEDGYILTNSYLLQDKEQPAVRLPDGQQLKAVIIGKDSFSDLAVLQIESEDLKPASFGDSSVLRVGDPVVAIGNPVGNSAGPLTDGIISAIHGQIKVGGGSLTLLQTNALPYSNQVGGLLMNCYGQIIGVHTGCASKVLSSTNDESFRYALDSLTVKSIADELIAKGFIGGRVHLGITGHEIDEFYESYYDIPQGIFITALDENSVLFEKGVREGDILLNLADTQILDFDTLNSLLSTLKQGQEVTAVVYRDGTRYQINMTIGEME